MSFIVKFRKLIRAGAVTFSFSVLLASLPAYADIFGYEAIENADLSAFKKWHEVQVKQKEIPVEARVVLAALSNPIKNMSLPEKLQWVNSYINDQIAYKTDKEVWGKSDYWATPAETLAKGAGDCDDFAILKYYILLQAGVSPDQMRIVILRDDAENILHAVLAVGTKGADFILDNRFNTLYTDSNFSKYSPIYALNHKRWWRFIPQLA